MSVVPQTGVSQFESIDTDSRTRRTVEESREPHPAHPPPSQFIIDSPVVLEVLHVVVVFIIVAGI